MMLARLYRLLALLLPPGAVAVAKIAEQEEQAGLRMLAESLEAADGN